MVRGGSNAITQAQRQATRASTTMLFAGVATTLHVRVAACTGVEVELLPLDCTVKTLDRGGAEDTDWCRYSWMARFR